MDTARWYRVASPGTDHYLYHKTVPPERPIFQGDVFSGVPNVFVRHPSEEAAGRRRGGDAHRPLVEPLPFDGDAVRGTTRMSASLAMLIPHICNYYEGEKGDRYRIRVVAQVRRKATERIPPDWNGAWALFPLPNLLDDGDEGLVQLDCVTTVEDAFLAKKARVAALSFEGWLALQQRLADFYARVQAPWTDLEALLRPAWDQVTDDQATAAAAMAEPMSQGRKDPPGLGDGEP